MRANIRTSSWLDQVKQEPSKGGSIRLQESIKIENSLIAQDKRPLVDLSEENLMTLKSPPKHQGCPNNNNNNTTSQYNLAYAGSGEI